MQLLTQGSEDSKKSAAVRKSDPQPSVREQEGGAFGHVKVCCTPLKLFLHSTIPSNMDVNKSKETH